MEPFAKSDYLPGGHIYPVIMTVPPADRLLKGKAKVTALSRHARTALDISANCARLILPNHPKNESGVPQPVGGVHWSVSHKSEMVAAVAAPLPVGIDIERVRPVSTALQQKVANDSEWRLSSEDPLLLFFRFWTAKEAILKMAGVGLRGLSNCRIIQIPNETAMWLDYHGDTYRVEHHRVGEHLVAVVRRRWQLRWQVLI
jgi:4'-phosphopantetheinyl transferase